ncbi:hypothetical protein ACWD4T_49240 [Streptomyces umbrinus]
MWTELTIAGIGLAGALGGVFMGGRVTQSVARQALQAESARLQQERYAAQERAAISEAMETLYELSMTPQTWHTGTDQERVELESETGRLLRKTELQLLLILDDDARRRLLTALYVTRVWHTWDPPSRQHAWIQWTAKFALTLLAAYARGDMTVPPMQGTALHAYRARAEHLDATGLDEKYINVRELMPEN